MAVKLKFILKFKRPAQDIFDLSDRISNKLQSIETTARHCLKCITKKRTTCSNLYRWRWLLVWEIQYWKFADGVCNNRCIEICYVTDSKKICENSKEWLVFQEELFIIRW